MNIEVIEPPAPLHDSHHEVWVKVQGDEIVNLADAWAAMEPRTRGDILARTENHRSVVDSKGRTHLIPTVCTWHPDRPQDEAEKALGAFIDWWIIPVLPPEVAAA